MAPQEEAVFFFFVLPDSPPPWGGHRKRGLQRILTSCCRVWLAPLCVWEGPLTGAPGFPRRPALPAVPPTAGPCGHMQSLESLPWAVPLPGAQEAERGWWAGPRFVACPAANFSFSSY